MSWTMLTFTTSWPDFSMDLKPNTPVRPSWYSPLMIWQKLMATKYKWIWLCWTFLKVPHERLLHKLNHYDIGGKTHKWIRIFLMQRSQSVVLEGSYSSKVHVTSGLPQGTVLRPLLFMLYINDLPDCVSSTARLFANDCVLYRVIESDKDTKHVNLDALLELETKWMMHFNPHKCYVIRFCPKQKETKGEYFIHGTKLEWITHSKYLGVWFDENFKWTRHVDTVVKKATQMHGFIRHNIHSCPKSFKEVAYKSLVHPHLEYGTTVWDPYTQKDTYHLEMVQRKPAHFVQSDYRHRSSVTRMLEGLKWESLKDRCTICRLTMVFKILNGEVAIPLEEFFEFNCTRTRHGHPMKLTRYQPKPDVLKYAFAPWTIPE